MANTTKSPRPAVFLDRDGALIEEAHYLSKVEQVRLLPGVVDGLRLLERAGFVLVVVTNQAGVARGYFPESQVGVIHRHLEDEFARRGVAISSWKFCPHHPTEGEGTYKVACDCRKPSPGMLLQAAKELNLDLPRSFMLGDKRSDLEAGSRAGCRTVLVRTGHGAEEEPGILPGLTGFLGASDSLTDAARLILRAAERDAPTLNHLRALA